MPTPKKYGPNTEWTRDELNTLTIMSKEYTSTEIARVIGRSKGSVQAQCIRKGIRLLKEGTNTAKGRSAETDALLILPGAKLITTVDYHAPFDLDWKGKRINVKSATLRFNQFARAWYWVFRTKEGWRSCDMFLLIGYVPDSNIPEKAWLVPSELCQKVAVGISRNCKRGMYADYELEVKTS